MTKQSSPAPAAAPATGIAVLLTRPEPQATRFAAELTARFGTAVRPVIAPLMQAEITPPALPAGEFAALILTSETGAAAAGQMLAAGAQLPEPCFCVGDRTASAAQAYGFRTLPAAGDARDLAALLRRSPDPGPMLYLHGEDRAADLAALVPERKITSLSSYRQIARPLSQEARALLSEEETVILPVMSPRSARLLAAALQERPCRARLVPVAISAAARAALPDWLAKDCVVARAPNAAAVMDGIAAHMPGAST